MGVRISTFFVVVVVVIAQHIFQVDKKLVSVTTKQQQVSYAAFDWELPFLYFEVYTTLLENLLLWKMKTLNRMGAGEGLWFFFLINCCNTVLQAAEGVSYFL